MSKIMDSILEFQEATNNTDEIGSPEFRKAYQEWEIEKLRKEAKNA